MILPFWMCWAIVIKPIDVLNVHDGDTFALAPVQIWPGIAAYGERVRVLGVDTPELKDSLTTKAREARTFTAQWIGQGPFALEGCKRDSFGRLLAIVYRGSDTLSVALIRAGLGVPR